MRNLTCGVYQIKNLINGKVYIGSSIHIQDRWTEHKRVLNNNEHHSQHLQRAWNYYGRKILNLVLLRNAVKMKL